MSVPPALWTLVRSRSLDVAALDPSMADRMYDHLAGLDEDEREAAVGQLAGCPNFVGTDLFDRTVSFAAAKTRRHLWSTGGATREQATRHFVTEPDQSIKGQMVLNYQLDITSSDVLMDHKDWTSRGMWRDVLAAVRAGRGRTLPLDVASRFVQKVPKRVYDDDREVLEQFLIGHSALACRVAADPDSSVYARTVACACADVPAELVIEAVQSLDAGGAFVNVAHLRYVLVHRPVMTGAEVDAVAAVAERTGLTAEVALDVADRRDWSWSAAEYTRHVRQVTSTAQLLGLVNQVPQLRWRGVGCRLTRATMESPYADFTVLQTVIGRTDGDSWAMRFWAPNQDVWRSPERVYDLLCLLAERPRAASFARELTAGVWDDAKRESWKQVLEGPGRAQFTAAVACGELVVGSQLWLCDVPWDGDLRAVVRHAPAGLLFTLGSAALVSAGANILGEVDGGSEALWGLVESFDLLDPTPLGDVIDRYVAATRPPPTA